MDAVQGPKCHQDNFSPHLQHSSSPQSWKMLSVSQLSGLFNTGEPWLFPRNISRVCVCSCARTCARGCVSLCASARALRTGPPSLWLSIEELDWRDDSAIKG